jgi:inorganic pyrophosphatase
MKYKVIIEIPKGCDRRIHMKYDGSGFEDFGPIKEKIPINNGVMPIDYGFIKNSLNKEEGDNVDAIIFSNNKYKTGDELDASVLGILKRDDNDHKIIAVDNTMPYKTFQQVPEDERRLILDYFTFGHGEIILGDVSEAERYLAENKQ